ncbi:flagellar protein FliS [Alphaproteobacteria bacterium]|nr:flagellar protein FliS [Alphaproteobacteria bacterium]
MNYHSMMENYKSTNTFTKVDSANEHDNIKIVLEDLLNNLKTLSYCLKNEPVNSTIKSKSFSQIIVALMILQTSLDFENGEPIASNLFNLYEYCRKSVIKNYTSQKTDDIDASIDVISDIFDGWTSIK